MSGDHSRFTFDPIKRYSGVLMQQGRVQLDSDWNEEIDILRRRIRTLSLDSFGPVGVPYNSLPDSFLLGLIGGPPTDLSIEPGRLYVDGLVAEAFPDEGATYLSQPFLPDPPPLPNGDSVAYLDVWDREVTYIEDPELLDDALGGADTTTRRQTVWQLRVAPVEVAECGLPVGEPPSAGRLTTEAVAPPAPDDPCILPPAGGYRGLENRLYRMEVHEGGPMNTARFKWSRDNASIVSAVTGIAVAGAQTTLRVNRIGRDEVLRFRIGDWVEVTDDHRELHGEPGEMALIVDLDEANRDIVLDRALPTPGNRAFGGNADELAERHTRVKRWDQTAATNAVDGDGLVTIGAAAIDIEDGVRVRFSTDPAGGEFRVGDYWVFWARTATASIEILDEAPPRGIVHHYVQLAAITGLGNDNESIDDCRPTEEGGEGCCTVVVHPGESIQAAIDSLPPVGGCVCLKAGVHDIDATIVIEGRGISLTGESAGAIVRGERVSPLLRIGPRALSTRVSSIQFQAGSSQENQASVIEIVNAIDVVVEGCSVRARSAANFVGIHVFRSDHVCIDRCLFRMVQMGVWVQGDCEAFSLRNSEMNLTLGLPNDETGLPQGFPGAMCVFVLDSSLPCRIEDNILSGALMGIVLNDAVQAGGPPQSLARGSIIAGNFVLGSKFVMEQDGEDRLPLINVASDFTTVQNNRVSYSFVPNTGILVTGSNCQVLGNHLVSRVREDDQDGPIGIQIGDTVDGRNVAVTGGLVHDNVLFGIQNGIVATGVENLVVDSNLLSAEEPARNFGISLTRVMSASVERNQIRELMFGIISSRGRLNRFRGNTLTENGAGISLGLEWSPAVIENNIDRATGWGALAMLILGRCEFIANRITSAGHRANAAVGIGALMQVGELHIESNEIVDTGNPVDEGTGSTRAYGIYGELILEARIESNLVTYTNAFTRDPQAEDRALRMRGFLEFTPTDNITFGFPIQVFNNKFVGAGRSALVELLQMSFNFGQFSLNVRFERVSFDHNYCMHITAPQNREAATVVLVGRRGIVMGNHVKAMPEVIPSVDFNNMPGPFIGNVTRGGAVNHADFPVTENNFNMTA